MLSVDQIKTYNTDGLVKSSTQLSSDKVKNLNSALDKYLEDHKDENNEFVSGLYERDNKFLEFAMYPEIISEVKQLIGEDIILWGSSLFCKKEKNGKETPWHQDGEYWPIRPLATCTVWIALDASTAANGCLRVIPGSHKTKQLAKHHHSDASNIALHLELDESEFDETKAVDIVLEPGEISLHDVYLYHGSEPNTSDHSRRGMTLRYMPTSSVYYHLDGSKTETSERLDLSNRTLYLMRGTDVSGQNDFRVRY